MKNLLKSIIGVFIFSMMTIQLSAQCSYEPASVASTPATQGTVGDRFGQSFTASCTGNTFTEVTFRLKNFNNAIFNLDLYSGESDAAGDLLYSQTNAGQPTNNGDGTYTYALGGGTGSLSFTSGQQYTIIGTLVSGSHAPEFAGGNGYTGGNGYNFNAVGGNTIWYTNTNDFHFVMGETTAPVAACDNSNETTTGTYTQIFSGDKVGQSITADASCYTGNAFSKFSFWSNTNSPTSWTVEIFNGETVSGSPIYSETDVAVVQSNLGGYSHVNLGTGQNITGSPVYVDGQVYTFLFSCTGGTVVAHHTGDTYAGGKAYDGSSFQAGEDLRFQIEANTMAPTIPTMGEWALIIFGLIVLSFGVVYVMRFQKMNNTQLAKG